MKRVKLREDVGDGLSHPPYHRDQIVEVVQGGGEVVVQVVVGLDIVRVEGVAMIVEEFLMKMITIMIAVDGDIVVMKDRHYTALKDNSNQSRQKWYEDCELFLLHGQGTSINFERFHRFISN